MTLAERMEIAQRDAFRLNCLLGTLKEKADAEDDACALGTLEIALSLIDRVSSELSNVDWKALERAVLAVQQ